MDFAAWNLGWILLCGFWCEFWMWISGWILDVDCCVDSVVDTVEEIGSSCASGNLRGFPPWIFEEEETPLKKFTADFHSNFHAAPASGPSAWLGWLAPGPTKRAAQQTFAAEHRQGPSAAGRRVGSRSYLPLERQQRQCVSHGGRAAQGRGVCTTGLERLSRAVLSSDPSGCQAMAQSGTSLSRVKTVWIFYFAG